MCRSQWPRGLRRGPAAARLLGLWVRIPPGAWMSVTCKLCVLSGRGVCVGLITRPEESYRVWCVWVWSWILDSEEALAHWGLLRNGGGRKIMYNPPSPDSNFLNPFLCTHLIFSLVTWNKVTALGKRSINCQKKSAINLLKPSGFFTYHQV